MLCQTLCLLRTQLHAYLSTVRTKKHGICLSCSVEPNKGLEQLSSQAQNEEWRTATFVTLSQYWAQVYVGLSCLRKLMCGKAFQNHSRGQLASERTSVLYVMPVKSLDAFDHGHKQSRLSHEHNPDSVRVKTLKSNLTKFSSFIQNLCAVWDSQHTQQWSLFPAITLMESSHSYNNFILYAPNKIML